MSKRRPLRLKVNHLEYQVLPLSTKYVQVEGGNGNYLGLHSPVDEAIYISADQAPADQARTLWHELLHAFWWAYNIPKEQRDEEKTCGVLESPLAALLRDNPHLAKALGAAYAGQPLVVKE